MRSEVTELETFLWLSAVPRRPIVLGRLITVSIRAKYQVLSLPPLLARNVFQAWLLATPQEQPITRAQSLSTSGNCG